MSFFSFLASLLDEVKIDLWDKIRTKLSGSTFTCHKSRNPPKPWLLITQLSIRSRSPFIFDDFDASGLHGCYQRAASGKWNIIPSIFCCLPQFFGIFGISSSYALLNIYSEVLYWIEVRWLCRPLHNIYFVGSEPLLCFFRCVFWVIILLENPS